MSSCGGKVEGVEVEFDKFLRSGISLKKEFNFYTMSVRIPESMTLAYGGNALKGEGPDGNTIEAQECAMAKAARSIVAIRAWVNKVVVVHGNGP